MYYGHKTNTMMASVGSFDFNAHWTPTRVHADLTCGAKDFSCKTGTIYVYNKWQREGTSSYTCHSSSTTVTSTDDASSTTDDASSTTVTNVTSSGNTSMF